MDKGSVNDQSNGPKQISAADWLVGGGEMGELIRAMDWSNTPLGPIDSWPHSLRTTLSICLASRFPMAIWWGPEITQLYNDGYRPFLGIKHPCSMGQRGDECWAEIWDVCGPLYRKVMATGESTWSADLQLLMERNRYLEETYFTFAYSPIRDEEGVIRGNLITVTETTERVLGERRLCTLRDLGSRASEARSAEEACEIAAQVLQMNTADVPFALVYLFDAERRAAHLVSVSNLDRQSAAAPRKIEFSEQRREEVWPLETVARTQQPELVLNLERFTQLPRGSWPESRRSALVLPLIAPSQQQVTGFLVAGVNPRRILDDQYRDFFNLVAGHVATAIANARAYEEERQRADALAELDRAKTAFFSNVSHEFRTPLTLMLGPLEDTLAQPNGLPPEDRARLEVAHRNSLRLLKLVNTLLDFSRIEAGRVEAVYEETDLAVFTAELAGMFRSAIEKAGLKLIVECPTLPEPVFVDRQMWEKIVFNLLNNAFKFTFAGQIEVALRWREAQVELSVRDTGVGIAADELPRIFERFHRVPNVRSRTYEGTGIGLALVQELARLHGGEANVQSAFGRGSTLTVTIKTGTAHLPKDRIGVAREAVSTSMGASLFVEEALRWLPDASTGVGSRFNAGPELVERVQGSTLHDEGGRMDEGPNEDSIRQSKTCGEPCRTIQNPKSKILLADDNADMREYVRRLLLPQGYEVVAVPDGEAALAAARDREPDLVLADVMMPRLDGFGLLRALRNDPATSTLPIILLSARAGEESRVEGFEHGADDYLVKPFSARELLARVGAQLMMSQHRIGALQRERILRYEAEKLNEVARSLTAELDLQTLVQKVTDAGTELTAAKFGAFFYNSFNERGESYLLYTLSGAPREAFDKFGIPRNTPLFEPTFHGAAVVRIDDVLKDSRYGHNPPHRGMPQGHLAVRSYLAVPVISRFGEVLGGLFFGHPEPAVFTEHAERIALGIAAQAAIAIDNAKLHGQAKKEIEERVRIEKALRESEERLRLVARAANDVIWEIDIKQDRVWWSEAMQSVFGYAPEAIGSDTAWFRERIHADDRDRVVHGMTEAIEGASKVWSDEFRYRRADGSYVYVVDRAYLDRDAEGSARRVIGGMRDITERKRAEQLLAETARQKEALYQLVERRQRAKSLEEIYDTAVDAILSALRCERAAILICDDSGVMRFVAWRGLSDSYRKSTEGHSPWKKEEPNPQPVCVPDVAASELDDSLKGVVAVEGIAALAFIPLVIDERLAGKFMIYYNTPHAFEDGELELSLTIAGQLALGIERVRAEEALRESEARFRQLADAMPQIVWTARPDGYIDYYNERWYEFTGFPRNELGQSRWESILHPDDVKHCMETYFSCIREGKPSQIEFRFKDRASGGYGWFMGRAVPIRNDRGEILKWVGTCTDIDDQKRGQERLENTVAERTRELQQANAALLRDMKERKKLEDQLLQAQKMESIGVLAGGIAHDFNNILNIIQGYTSVLSADGSQSKQTGESLTIINESIQRGSALVQQLLTLARKGSTQRESVNANAVVEGLIALMTQTFPKTIELSASLEADLPPITADKNQIEQALLNLCVNARDAMGRGGKLILKTQSVDGATLQDLEGTPEERYVCMEVADTGMGMDEDVRDRIFEPFFTTKDKSQGTGLGLSVVYGIVKNHKGVIHVESMLGRGTTFRLYFPVSPAAARPTIDRITPLSPETRKESKRCGTILLVEDEKEMLYLMEKVLLRHGYRVLTANDGEKALDVYQRHNGTIDAVLLDIGLPKIAGRDVLRQMQQQNPAVRVVIASGYLDPALKSEISEAGVQYFVDKPYRLDQVVDTLQYLIEQKS